MKTHNLIHIAIILFLPFVINAQVEYDLYSTASSNDEGISLYFVPSSDSLWVAHRSTGYKVVRSELSPDGTEVSEQVIAAKLLPRNQSFFDAVSETDNPILKPIGGLLYDPTFDFPSSDELEADEMKYNFIMTEVQNYMSVAEALGLGIFDGTATLGKSYKYTVSSSDGSVTETVIILHNGFNLASAPENVALKFDLPNNMSLSDMYLKASPFERKYIRAIGKSYGDSIVLRWGMNNAALWETAKKEGVAILRTTDDTNFDIVAVVNPWKEEDINPSIEEDSMAILAAGILYGIKEDLAAPNRSLYEQKAVSENILGFAMFAADKSPLAADILGLRWVDTDVQKDTKYTYLLSTEGIEDIWDAGKVTIWNVQEDLEQVDELTYRPLDGSVKLQWPIYSNVDRFSSYTIDKSLDGNNFTTITGQPLVFMDTDKVKLTQYSYIDDLPLGQKATYRVYGYDAFGERSIAAEIVAESADLTPPPAVEIVTADYDADANNISLSWEPPMEQPSDFDHYLVLLSTSPEGNYDTLSTKLSSSTTTYMLDLKDMDTDRGFHFKVASIDRSNNGGYSFAQMVVVPDLTAPQAPPILTGSVDTLSMVTVAWEESPSTDVEGYWLYYANNPDDEMTLVNDELLTQNFYTYYLDEESLTESIFFCVRAQDDSYNRSLTSEVLEVKRLDKIPPVTPFDVRVVNDEGAIQLSWSVSPSDDVSRQYIYRREENDRSEWNRLAIFGPDGNTFIDTLVTLGTYYEYFLQAEDYSENVSDTSSIKYVSAKFAGSMAEIQNLDASVAEDSQISLNWSFSPEGDLKSKEHSYDIYRGEGNGPMRLLTSTDQTSFQDTEVLKDVLYKYGIKVKFANGWQGDLSDLKGVLIEKK